ncbi:hypothetical protein BJ878DRAFT_539158 [Calycina marina]|uniref:Uncharacterized protein n=1 Tax=Calycina marina TaxID=1763456 RepID=A0A9P7Z919_9HELO|nr:hypothetical protein BJ878DRAFT_539158 [Calycina marina]
MHANFLKVIFLAIWLIGAGVFADRSNADSLDAFAVHEKGIHPEIAVRATTSAPVTYITPVSRSFPTISPRASSIFRDYFEVKSTRRPTFQPTSKTDSSSSKPPTNLTTAQKATTLKISTAKTTSHSSTTTTAAAAKTSNPKTTKKKSKMKLPIKLVIIVVVLVVLLLIAIFLFVLWQQKMQAKKRAKVIEEANGGADYLPAPESGKFPPPTMVQETGGNYTSPSGAQYAPSVNEFPVDNNASYPAPPAKKTSHLPPGNNPNYY